VNPIGTGPYLPEATRSACGQVLVKREGTWWGTDVYGGPFLDRIEYIDVGIGPGRAGGRGRCGRDRRDLRVDRRFHRGAGRTGMGEERGDHLGHVAAIRYKHTREPYTDVRVRRALQMAVSNAVVLELGYNDLGDGGREPPRLPDPPRIRRVAADYLRPGRGEALLMQEAGVADFEHELISPMTTGSCQRR
jgi:peptide/nickel transport system substrate-binding protein